MKAICSQHVGQFQIDSLESVTFNLIRFLSNCGEQRMDGVKRNREIMTISTVS